MRSVMEEYRFGNVPLRPGKLANKWQCEIVVRSGVVGWGGG